MSTNIDLERTFLIQSLSLTPEEASTFSLSDLRRLYYKSDPSGTGPATFQDSGWRQLAGLTQLPFDINFTDFRIRRIGYTVFIGALSTYMLDDGATQADSQTTVVPIPEGFRSIDFDLKYPTKVTGITMGISHVWNCGVVPSNATYLVPAAPGMIIYPTTEVWPAILPGEAA